MPLFSLEEMSLEEAKSIAFQLWPILILNSWCILILSSLLLRPSCPVPTGVHSSPDQSSGEARVWGWAQEFCLLGSWAGSLIVDSWGKRSKIACSLPGLLLLSYSPPVGYCNGQKVPVRPEVQRVPALLTVLTPSVLLRCHLLTGAFSDPLSKRAAFLTLLISSSCFVLLLALTTNIPFTQLP